MVRNEKEWERTKFFVKIRNELLRMRGNENFAFIHEKNKSGNSCLLIEEVAITIMEGGVFSYWSAAFNKNEITCLAIPSK